MASNNDDFASDPEWLEALETEAPEDTGADDDKGTDDGADDKGDDNGEADDKGADGNADDDAGADDAAGDDDDSKGDEDDDDGDKSEDDKPSGEADKQEPSTKEAVKEALQEIETSKADRSAKVESLRLEVAKTLYPEGLDRTLRDSDGDPIRGIDDLTKLINPKTGDFFTEEEAGSWLLSAQQKLNQQVQQVEAFIEDVAETNLQLEEGAARVVQKYEKVLTANPDLKDRLLAGYNKTLVKDPKTGIAIKAPVDVVEFFDLALEPMLKQQAAEADAAAKAAKEAEERAKKTRQQERGDLKPSGKAEQLQPEDKEWAEAYKSYEEGEVK